MAVPDGGNNVVPQSRLQLPVKAHYQAVGLGVKGGGWAWEMQHNAAQTDELTVAHGPK